MYYPQIGVNWDSFGISPICLCAACQIEIVFFKKDFFVFCFNDLTSEEYRYMFNGKSGVYDCSMPTQAGGGVVRK